MFRLILNPQTEAKVFYLSSGKRIYISSEGEKQPLISEEEPLTSHLLIETTEEWWAYNKEDPLVTLNGEFFKEKRLRHLDILIADGYTLLFEEIEKSKKATDGDMEFKKGAVGSNGKEGVSDFKKELLSVEDQDLEDALKELEKQTLEGIEDSYVAITQLLSNDEIERLIKDATALEWQEHQLLQETNNSKEVEAPTEQNYSHQETSPYCPYHTVSEDTVDSSAIDGEEEQKENEDHQDRDEQSTEEEASSLHEDSFQTKSLFFKKSWRWWGTVVLSALVIFLLFLGSFISHLQEKRETQEIQAAQSVADIAMALSYAHINGIKPKGHSWSDPSFIKKNLAATLSKRYLILGNMDAQGRLENSSYLLRIYTTNDLSHFVVIAQPNANLLQWIAPNPAIVVDSKEMELRKLSDVKELNRLLVKPQALEDESGKALSDLIASAPVIPLADLASRYGKLGFMPPRSLVMLDPQARDKIYNAPRYFLFSQQVMDRALASFHTPPLASQAAVIEELKNLAKLNHLVLYNTESYEKTKEGQEALAKLLPDNKFMFGYLRIDTSGKLLHSQLLLRTDREPAEQLSGQKMASNQPTTAQEVYMASLDTSSMALQSETSPLSTSTIDKGSFQERIKEIKNERSQRLGFIIQPYIELLQSYTMRYDPLLPEMTQEMLTRVAQEEKLLEVELRVKIEKLFKEYEHEPMELLLRTLTDNHLDYLPLEEHRKESEQIQGEKIEQILQSIEVIADADDLIELQKRVHHSSQMLRWSYLPNTEKLIFYQRQLADQLLEQLRLRLLTSAATLSTSLSSYNLEEVLSELFKDARLNNDPEIHKYFAEELDKIKSEQEAPQELPLLGK